MNKDRHLCKTCQYRSTGRKTNGCDYIVIVGHSRGCPAAECTAYEKGNKIKTKRHLKIKKRRIA